MHFDLTQIDHPLFFIFNRIKQITSSDYRATSKLEEYLIKFKPNKIIRRLTKLYQLCEGLNILRSIDESRNNHIFYLIVDVINDINSKKYPKFTQFIYKIFNKLLNSSAYDYQFFLRRNIIFYHPETESEINLYGADFVSNLKLYDDIYGCNIFEYCFLYKNRAYQCKLFVRLLDVWLTKIHLNSQVNMWSDYISDQITTEEGELYYIFNDTFGFHINDIDNHTPLYYAVKYGLNKTIEFYVNYVFKILIQNKKCKWIMDQSYLSSIVRRLLQTESNQPSINLFHLLLSSSIFDLNYIYKGKYLAHYILLYRSVSNSHKDYLLSCFESLHEFNYNFADTLDSDGNNVLHYASFIHDTDAVKSIIKLCKLKRNNSLKKLLNTKNKKNRFPLTNALNNDSINVVKLLILQSEQVGINNIQTIEYQLFAQKFVYKIDYKSYKWITCLYQIIENSKTQTCTFLENMNDNISMSIYNNVKLSFNEFIKESNPSQELFNSFKIILNKLKPQNKLNKLDPQRAAAALPVTNENPLNPEAKLIKQSSLNSTYSVQIRTTDSLINDDNSFASNEYNKINNNSNRYYRRIRLKINNKCFGFENVSPIQAAYTWLTLDMMHIAIIPIILIFITNLDSFFFQYFCDQCNVSKSLIFLFIIFWIIIDIITIFSIRRGIKYLILFKLIIFIFSTLLINGILLYWSILSGSYPDKLQLISLIIYCILNILFNIFAFRDVYKIYKLILEYKNENISKIKRKNTTLTLQMKLEMCEGNIYKIINKFNEPALNGKYCKVLLLLDEETYRVKCFDESIGVRIMNISNLELTQKKEFQVNSQYKNKQRHDSSIVDRYKNSNNIYPDPLKDQQHQNQMRIQRLLSGMDNDELNQLRGGDNDDDDDDELYMQQ